MLKYFTLDLQNLSNEQEAMAASLSHWLTIHEQRSKQDSLSRLPSSSGQANPTRKLVPMSSFGTWIRRRSQQGGSSIDIDAASVSSKGMSTEAGIILNPLTTSSNKQAMGGEAWPRLNTATPAQATTILDHA